MVDTEFPYRVPTVDRRVHAEEVVLCLLSTF